MRRTRVYFRLLIFAIFSAFLVSGAGAQIRREFGAGAPPPVISKTLIVKRGERVNVPLQIHGTRGGQLEFVIRSQPLRGKLGPLKSTGMNSAIVTYTAPTRGNITEDRFTFAVRSGEGVSAPGVILLKFFDPPMEPPKLKAPAELDFAPVFEGQVSALEMELENEGGGSLEGEVSVSAPFEIDGIKAFRLTGGARTTIRLLFKSDKIGETNGEVIVNCAQRKVIPVRARVEERLSVTPSQLKLVAKTGSQTRSATVQIANRSDEDVVITVGTSARLLTESAVTVAARGTANMPVIADAADAGAFDETLKLSAEGWSKSIPVRAVALGAILKFASSKASIMGAAGGISATTSVVLENAGGEDVTVRLEIEQPFELEKPVVIVPKRGQLEIPIRMPKAGPGNYSGTLKAVGLAVPAEVALLAELGPPGMVESRAPSAPLNVPNVTNVQTTSKAVAGEPAESAEANDTDIPELVWMPQTREEIPNALGRFAKRVGPTFAFLEWPASLGTGADLRFELRELALADGQLKVGWAPLASVRVTQEGETIRAEVQDLAPASVQTIRAFTLKGDEKLIVFTSEFTTPRKKGMFDSVGWRMPALLVALGVLAFSIWRSRRASKSAT